MKPAPLRLGVLRTLATALGTLVFASAALAETEKVTIFAAGSLRGVVTEVAAAVSTALGVEVNPTFGGSGSLRERIEAGEKADLFMSADLGSPRKLEAQSRTVVPVIEFARNRMCVISRRTDGISTANLVDRLLAKDVRIRTSTPVVDPSGDYAWAIFDRIEVLRPGSGTALKDKARASMQLTATPATPTQSPAAALFASRAIDLSITYCSGAAGLEKELPELTSLVVPTELDPHPQYGLAVLTKSPAASQVALFILSEKGQAIIGRQGLLPVAETVKPVP